MMKEALSLPGIVLYGLSHHQASLEEREPWAQEERLKQALLAFEEYPGVYEMACLNTCNRTEFYFVSETTEKSFYDALFTTTLPFLRRDKFFFETGKEAIAHLFRVASGADSMMVGELQILSQIEKVLQALLKKPNKLILGTLFRHALHTGKRCRTETSISQGNLSIAQAALTLARNIFGDMTKVSVLLVGSGEMGQLTAHTFRRAHIQNLFVTSRTPERAQELAKELATQAIPFPQLFSQIKTVDVVITCTGASLPIIPFHQVKKIMRQRRYRPLFFLDLAVPRDIEESVNLLENVYLYNLDDLENMARKERAKRENEIKRVELIVNQETEHFFAWYQGLKARPILLKLLTLAEKTIASELEKRKAFLASLTEEQQKEIEILLRQSMKKFLHFPLTKLKELAQDPYHEQIYLELLQKIFEEKKIPIKP